MNVYVILIACVQALHTPLHETCITEPLSQKFKSVPECIAYINDFKYTLRDEPDLYISGFCTTKNAARSS